MKTHAKRTAWNKGLRGVQVGYWKGKKFPPEYRKKLSEVHKGLQAQEKHPLWKGQEAGYTSVHIWVARYRGKPRLCEHCGSTTAKRFEWANKSGRYLRDLEDWIRLCKSCHHEYDNISKKIWASRRLNVKT